MRRASLRRMLRFSLIVAILSGCGATVTTTPLPTDSAVTDTQTTDTGSVVVDTSDIPPSAEVGLPPMMPGVTPPPRPSVMVAGGATRWFAISRMQLGMRNRATGALDANAWKQYGFDFDGRVTSKEDSKTSANSCKRREGSPTNVLADGELGRDNNFGQHVMSVVRSLSPGAEDAMNEELRSGRTTLLLRLDNVGPTDNGSVPGALYLAAGLGSPPREDGTDVWPIDSSSVDAAKEARAKFPKGYMAGGVWVSGDFGVGFAPIPLPTTGTRFSIPLQSPTITFDVASGAMGTIAGAANATAFMESFTPLLKRWGICPGNATYEQVFSTATQSADLVAGAPQLQNTAVTCDSISFAVGFTTVRVAPSTSIVTPPPAKDECL